MGAALVPALPAEAEALLREKIKKNCTTFFPPFFTSYPQVRRHVQLQKGRGDGGEQREVVHGNVQPDGEAALRLAAPGDEAEGGEELVDLGRRPQRQVGDQQPVDHLGGLK